MSNLHAIDSYSRGRKLQGYKRRHPMAFVNEIHSILAEIKHGESKALEVTQDERRTKKEIETFKVVSKAFDKIHPEEPTNKLWIKMQT